MTAASRIVAVLGMHRSGTSWLAGSLQDLGLEMGEVSTRDTHNVKGNRESPVLMEIHDGVLADNGGNWKRPPQGRVWSDARRSALAAHIRDMNSRFPRGWGFKDPRALLVLDEWLRQAPDMARVGIFRHPAAVHRSLAARSARFDEERSLDLWRVYNKKLVDEHRRSPFPILRFDVPADELFAGLRTVAQSLELAAVDRTSRFFDADLVHFDDAAQAPVPRVCADLWAYLEEQVVRA